MHKFIGVVSLVVGLAGAAAAQQIATRTQLNQILSTGYEYTDAFQAYSIASGGAATLGVSSMNSTSILNGQGPGLLDPGVTYSTANQGDLLQWNGVNYVGSMRQEILSNDNSLVLTYTMGVDAMGVDLRDYAGYGQNFTADVYNGSNLVGQLSGTLAGAGTTQFFGWENAGGITSVVFTGSGSSDYWSPIIQEHSYGQAVLSPEPSTIAAFALGGLILLRRRRKA